MNTVIHQAKKDGICGVLRAAYSAYGNDRAIGRSHEKALKSIERDYYITPEQFDAMVQEFGEYEDA